MSNQAIGGLEKNLFDSSGKFELTVFELTVSDLREFYNVLTV